MAEVYFFGCWGQAGHHLRAADRMSVRDSDRLRIPSDRVLDGGPTFLPPEGSGQAALTYLPACNVTILAWWGNPWDKRPGTNNAILVRGKHDDIDAVWAHFNEKFPSLASQLKRPGSSVGGRANG